MFMTVCISLQDTALLFFLNKGSRVIHNECYLHLRVIFFSHLNICDTVSVPLCLLCKRFPSRCFKTNVNSDSRSGIEPSCTLLSIFPQPVSNLSGRTCGVRKEHFMYYFVESQKPVKLTSFCQFVFLYFAIIIQTVGRRVNDTSQQRGGSA